MLEFYKAVVLDSRKVTQKKEGQTERRVEMSKREKVVRKVTVVDCDLCHREFKEGKTKKFGDDGCEQWDVCSECFKGCPEWAIKNAGAIIGACSSTGRMPLQTLGELAHGIWVLMEGWEDAGALRQFDSLDKAKEWIADVVLETSDDYCWLGGVYQDGKDLGAVVDVQVKFTKLNK
jgi:hypothetical protein